MTDVAPAADLTEESDRGCVLVRAAMLEVGLPAAKHGLPDSDPTIAQVLKPLGQATAQIGNNPLGDRNEHLPTVHDFDEFYGILYHLNALEELYDSEYPNDERFRARFGPPKHHS